MVSIPQYVPFPREMAQKFERLKDESIPPVELKNTERELLKAAVEFLDQIVNEKEDADDADVDRLEPLKRLLESFESIVQTEAKTKQFNGIFDDAKGRVRANNRRQPELSVDNLNQYGELNADDLLFSRILERNMANAREVNIGRKFRDDPNYTYLKNAAFILDHPLDPIPDENEDDDDDLQVEGGKVDLKCPIMVKIFETPMTSVKCNHTFDLESINGTWRTESAVQPCPIPGCAHNLRKSDFQPDRLMSLRVKSYNRLQKKLEGQQHYEKL